MSVSRRVAVLSAASAAAAISLPRWACADAAVLSGNSLFADVKSYAGLGIHRTGTVGDNATTTWMKARFEKLGFDVETQDIPYPLFVPKRCEAVPPVGSSVPLFPSWPVVPTDGVSGVLRLPGSAKGAIAVVDLPAARGTLDDPSIGDALLAAEHEGAIAVIGLCGGKTGDVIAQNADFEKFTWTVPVLLAPGRSRQRLLAAAHAGENWTIVCTGARDADAVAQNVIARRAGAGKTICISTPKSGWFFCAGERGTGIAIWLALAERLAQTKADLLFVAATGHELNFYGSHIFLQTRAPKPEAVKFWLHLGANIAVDDVAVTNGSISPTSAPPTGRFTRASAQLLPLLKSAFQGQPGYDQPLDVDTSQRLGELAGFHDKGYAPLMGMLGTYELFHIPSDVPEYATSPAILEPVARALDSVVMQIAST
jgi:hypothetical protein